jgi:hypothetical protein
MDLSLRVRKSFTCTNPGTHQNVTMIMFGYEKFPKVSWGEGIVWNEVVSAEVWAVNRQSDLWSSLWFINWWIQILRLYWETMGTRRWADGRKWDTGGLTCWVYLVPSSFLSPCSRLPWGEQLYSTMGLCHDVWSHFNPNLWDQRTMCWILWKTEPKINLCSFKSCLSGIKHSMKSLTNTEH